MLIATKGNSDRHAGLLLWNSSLYHWNCKKVIMWDEVAKTLLESDSRDDVCSLLNSDSLLFITSSEPAEPGAKNEC